MTKLKFKSDNFKSIFYNFSITFFIYIHKCLKVYQLNIINKIKLVKDIKIFLKKKKKKKRYFDCESYQHLSEDKKQKLVGYRKKYYRMRKNSLL